MSTEARVGAFIVAGMLLLGGMILKLGDVSLKRTYRLQVSFKDVAGLPDKSIVKLSGVEVGKVKDIKLENDLAVVDVAIEKDVKIYRDAHFRIGATSLIGSKFLQIDQGTRASGVLQAGDKVSGDVDEGLERMLSSTLKSVSGLIDELKETMGQKGPLVQNITATTQNMREMTANMNDLMATVKPDLERSVHNTASVMDKLDMIMSKADELMTKLNTSSGTVGALISDVEMKDNVKSTVANFKEASDSAKEVLGRFGRFRFYWNATARNEPEAHATKGDIGLRIVPREGKYYYLGARNLGSETNTPKHTDYEEKNTIDAVMGWYGKWWEFYAGALRTSFGFGGRVYPFPSVPYLDKVSLSAEATDFGRNRVIKGRTFDSPEYDAGVDVQVHRLLKIGAHVRDIAEVRNYMTTANLSFEDKDIAYFFGLVSFSGSSKGASK